jgi:peroxiredoxin (alkyl hydroperoxide reductase subunit C)
VIRALTWYPMNVGRSVEEMVRLLTALQRTAQEDVMTPEGWQPGGELLLPPAQAVSAALESEPPGWFYRTRRDA